MLSIPVLVTADQYWRRPPARPPVLTAELSPLVAAESLTPLAEAESLAQLVADDPLAPMTPTEPVLVQALPGRRRRQLRRPIRRAPR